MKSSKSPDALAGKAANPAAEGPAPVPSYHHGNLRAALIEAGMAALEAGKNNTPANHALSLRDVARQVGVTANAAYRHFADKEALLKALAAEGFRQLAAQSQAAHDGAVSRTEGFRASGLAYVRFARAHPALFRLMFGRITSGSQDAELTAASMHAFQGVLTSASDLAGLPTHDPRALVGALIAWSLVHGLGHLALDGQLDHFGTDVDQLIETVMAQVDPRAQR